MGGSEKIYEGRDGHIGGGGMSVEGGFKPSTHYDSILFNQQRSSGQYFANVSTTIRIPTRIFLSNSSDSFERHRLRSIGFMEYPRKEIT